MGGLSDLEFMAFWGLEAAEHLQGHCIRSVAYSLQFMFEMLQDISQFSTSSTDAVCSRQRRPKSM